MARTVNKVILVGHLTRDPELRYTPQGTPVADFSIATNREWVTNGERQESVEFHNIVAWSKLAELCNQLLRKGSKVYVEGRLQTRDWQTESGEKRYKTEIVISEMILLSGGRDYSPENRVSADKTPTNEVTSEANPTAPEVDADIDIDELLQSTEFDVEE